MRILLISLLNRSISIFISIVFLLICSGCGRTLSDSKIASGYTDSVFPIKDDSLDIASTLILDNEIDYVSFFDSSSSVTEDSLVVVYGIVQSSRIREFDNHDFEAEYQVEALEKSFFLLTQMNLDKYWGKRVRVEGRLAERWTLDLSKNPRNTFDRIPMLVDSINEILNDSICNFRYIIAKDNYDYRTILSGYILRRHRISSDISMDYSLALDQAIQGVKRRSFELSINYQFTTNFPQDPFLSTSFSNW